MAVLIWNFISPWSAEWWSWYFFVTIIVVGIIIGVISMVWFMIGGMWIFAGCLKTLLNAWMSARRWLGRWPCVVALSDIPLLGKDEEE